MGRGSLGIAAAAMLLVASGAAALQPADLSLPEEVGFRVDEPVFLGVSHQNEEWGLEFLLSLRLHPGWIEGNDSVWAPDRVYLVSFTTQGTQELGLESQPVVGKRFHVQILPTVFSLGREGAPEGSGFLAVSLYGHESNGQSVQTREEFRALLDRFVAEEGRAEDDVRHFASARLSRGWDLSELQAGWRGLELGPTRWAFGARAAMYWDWGFLQRDAEETYDFETADVQRRRDVNGFRLTARPTYRRLSLEYSVERGLSARYSHRLEASVRVRGAMDLALRLGSGYANDLAEFNRDTDDLAIGLVWRQ